MRSRMVSNAATVTTAGHRNPLKRIKSNLVRLVIGLWLSAAIAGAAEQIKNSDCLDCHLDPTTTRKVDGKVVSLLFPTNSFAKSVHAKLIAWIATRESRKWCTRANCRHPIARSATMKEGEGICDQHSRREPRAGRVRARPIAGIATVRTKSAGQRPAIRLCSSLTCRRRARNATATRG